MGKLKLEEVGDDCWVFVWPRSAEGANKLFYEGMDFMDEGDIVKVRDFCLYMRFGMNQGDAWDEDSVDFSRNVDD